VVPRRVRMRCVLRLGCGESTARRRRR